MTTFDGYRRKSDPSERMATMPGAGLPSHVRPEDWELILPGSQVIEGAEDDIAARGFCHFKLVER